VRATKVKKAWHVRQTGREVRGVVWESDNMDDQHTDKRLKEILDVQTGRFRLHSSH
jgi:hypothetical protein